jgi:hypothetical protein
LESRSFFAPFSDVTELVKQPLVIGCLVLMIAVQLAGNHLISIYSRPFPLGGQAMVQIVMLGVPALKFAVFIGVFFILARRLGGPIDSAGKPNLIIWLGLMITYFVVTRAASLLPTMLPDMGQMGTRRLPATLTVVSYAVRLMFYPVMAFIAAAVHNGASTRFSEVWAYLTKRGVSWYVCFALFGLVYAILLFVMPLGLGTASGVPPRGALFSMALVGMGGQLINMLFAIAAYRTLKYNGAARP